jgi:hypothetical protein
MLWRMEPKALLEELENFAVRLSSDVLTIHRTAAAIDERQDGEAVTRMVLLLNEPDGETWDVDRVRELREALGRKATELELPPVSLTLVPESEADLIEAFTR